MKRKLRKNTPKQTITFDSHCDHLPATRQRLILIPPLRHQRNETACFLITISWQNRFHLSPSPRVSRSKRSTQDGLLRLTKRTNGLHQLQPAFLPLDRCTSRGYSILTKTTRHAFCTLPDPPFLSRSQLHQWNTPFPTLFPQLACLPVKQLRRRRAHKPRLRPPIPFNRAQASYVCYICFLRYIPPKRSS